MGRIKVKREPPPPARGDHAISIRIDTYTKIVALRRISEMNPEITRVGGKALTLGSYTKRALSEYPSLCATFRGHQALVRKLTTLRDVLRLRADHLENAQLDQVATLLDTLLTDTSSG